MKSSKSLMKTAQILPKLRLGERREGDNRKVSVHPTGPHRVKMVADRVGKGADRETSKVIDVVIYTVEENGELRQYQVPVKARETGELHYLVQRLSEVEEGQEVILEMKKRGFKNYVEVLNLNGEPIGVNEEGISDPEDDADEPEEEAGEAEDSADGETTPAGVEKPPAKGARFSGDYEELEEPAF